MSEKMKVWKCTKKCIGKCHTFRSVEYIDQLPHCSHDSYWKPTTDYQIIKTRPLGEIKKTSLPEKYKLVIPVKYFRWVHPELKKRQGEISDMWDDALHELGWLVEIKDEPIKKEFDKWFAKWFQYSDVPADYINTWNAWLASPESEALKYKTLVVLCLEYFQGMKTGDLRCLILEELEKLNQNES